MGLEDSQVYKQFQHELQGKFGLYREPGVRYMDNGQRIDISEAFIYCDVEDLK